MIVKCFAASALVAALTISPVFAQPISDQAEPSLSDAQIRNVDRLIDKALEDDLATGAIDDASGIAITTAAAKLVGDLRGKPRHTLRVVMWGAEEVGVYGGKAYAE